MQATAPPDQQENPYLPPGPPPIVFADFTGGLNTNSSRPGVDDKELYWCDGFFPIGKDFLRTMYGVGSAIYTASGVNVSFFDFANIGSTPYCLVFQSDGSIVAVNTTTKASMQVAPPGTILNPSQSTAGLSQWGSQYVIMVSGQTNGYFLWDGSVFYGPGTLAPPVTVVAGGNNYEAPTITASGGSGTGATFLATLQTGIITSVSITNPGRGYKSGDSVTLSVTDVNGTGASLAVNLMPFGISGQAVETFSGRVIVTNNNKLIIGAPGSPYDFNETDGSVQSTNTSSFQRVSYTQPLQTNGFCYLISDSSIDYISGIQTSGSVSTTTFTNQNADPEIGTPYASTIDVFSRNIVFGNDFGAHVSYGGAVSKISDNLDGVYDSLGIGFGGFVPSACKAIVFGKRIWCLLIPVIDFVTNQQVNKLFCWDGKKWFSTQQDVNLVFCQHQEINSDITAYGTDGISIYPLFQQPSTGFTKRLQSKLWSGGQAGYIFEKGVNRLWGLANYYSPLSPNLTVGIDNELGTSSQTVALGLNQMTWTGLDGNPLTWTGLGGNPLVWEIPGGIVVFPPTAISQNGALLGFSVSTNAADMALISLAMDNQEVGYRG